MPPFRRALILALFLISLGAGMLHMRIHPVYYVPKNPPAPAASPDKAPAPQKIPAGEATASPNAPAQPQFSLEHLFAILICLVDVVVVTALFCSIRTVSIAYLLNGMFVIFGTVFMAHFSIADLSQGAHPWTDWIVKSTLADIIILWTDFFIGKAIYDSYTLAAPT